MREKYYTGVGARSTPPTVLKLMTACAVRLRELGWTLRTGAADGADTAFEIGAGENKEVFLPWSSFNGSSSVYKAPSLEAIAMAAEVHPVWKHLSQGAKALHARNCHQVLGPDLRTPSAFVLCWTKDGAQTVEECTKETGGTATAIRIADIHGIPVFNTANPEALGMVARFLKKWNEDHGGD